MKIFVETICWAALVFVLSCSVSVFGQQTRISLVTQEQIAETVRLAPCEADQRLAAVQKLFARAGAQNVSVEKFNHDNIVNVSVRVKGKTEETIIVGAHYDKVKVGCGAIDNWTGISILAALFQTVNQTQPEKSYIFVAFDKEEIGLLGSDAMAKAIPKENLEQFCAMINFDSFGFGIPQVMENTSSPKLISVAKKTIKDLQLPFAQAAIFEADADSSSFKSRNIPAITFHGLSNDWQKYLHGSGDKIEKINMTSVYYGYRVGLNFIFNLDKTSCAEIRK